MVNEFIDDKASETDSEVAAINAPPHSVEAEQSILGALLISGSNANAWDDVVEKVSAVDFYRADHREIFTVISTLTEEGKPIDVVTVSEGLSRLGLLEKTGGIAYLGTLAKNTPSAANIGAYANIVRERAVLRQLISISNKIATNAYHTDGRSSGEVLDEAERRIFEIAEMRSRGPGPQPIKSLLAAAVNKIDELYHSDGKLTGLPTGFSDLDAMTNGLQPADLIIVAGRPSMGKTTFAMNVCEHVAVATEKPVLVFSMEMPADSIVMRMLSSLGRIDQTRVRSGQLQEEDWPRVNSAMSILSNKKIFIDDSPALNPLEVRARARRIFREHGEIGAILVDYLQLMQVPGAQNRVNEISEISRSLKALAKEMNAPVIALSQLNRGLEQRPNKRPVMSDLRESGAIEQDADIIAFIYRDEVYNRETNDKGVAEIIIGKHRNGPIGVVKLAFLGQYTRFEDLAHDYSGGGDMDDY